MKNIRFVEYCYILSPWCTGVSREFNRISITRIGMFISLATKVIKQEKKRHCGAIFHWPRLILEMESLSNTFNTIFFCTVEVSEWKQSTTWSDLHGCFRTKLFLVVILKYSKHWVYSYFSNVKAVDWRLLI